MTYIIPNNGELKQTNRGDIFGNINHTQNIDLQTNRGRIRVSPRLIVAVKDDDASITGMGVPIAFCTHDVSSTKQYYAATGIGTGIGTAGTGRLFRSDDTDFNSDWDNDGTANTPTDIHLDYSDMINWRDSLVVSTFTLTTSHLKRLTGTWDTAYHTTTSFTFETAGGPKVLCEGFNGNLYVGDDDEVSYITPAGAAVQPANQGTLNFNGQYRVTWIRSGSDRLWIGLMSFDSNVGTKGFVAEWNTSGTAADRIYDINAPCALSCTLVDDIPYIIDAYGVLRKFDGTGFREVARLPVANERIEMPGIFNDLTNSRWIHQRGMDAVDGKINISVNNLVSTGVYVEEMPSGIWEYDPDIGLYHKNSPCADTSDFGQQGISTSGAIFGTRRTEGTFLAGFGYYTDNASTERKAVFYDDIVNNTSKRGTIATTFLPAGSVEDVWKKVIFRHGLLASGNKIIGKYRKRKSINFPFVAAITWTSTTTFTSTSSAFANVVGGEEITGFMGKSASTTAHVASISEAGGTYTVTIDEAVGQSSGTGKVLVDNYQKIDQITETDIDFKELPLSAVASTQLQVKAELRFSQNTELNDIIIVNSPHKLME